MDKNKIAVDVFNRLAKKYQDKYMDVEMYGDTFDFFCNNIGKENAEILEIACGPGNITRYLLEKRPDFKLLGIDLAPNMIQFAKANNPKADFQVMDCRNISAIDRRFDAIMCGFCLPYLSKEETKILIHDASKLLNSNGLLYLSTMEDDYNNSGYQKGSEGDEIFMHYYQADDLTNVLTENHFKTLKLERIISESQDGTKTTDLIIIAEKQPN